MSAEFAFLGLGGWLFASGTVADPYNEAFARSAAREAAGDLDGAVLPLVELAPQYPQDYALRLQMGWIYFNAGRYEEAARAYREALHRSPDAAAALTGLGWSLARLDRCEEAEHHFEHALRVLPIDAAAHDGLTFCAARLRAAVVDPRWSAWARVGGGVAHFQGHSFRTETFSAAVTGDVRHRSGVFFGASYRFAPSLTRDSAIVPPWNQHEAYARLGWANRRFGAMATYAALHETSGFQGTSHHVGLWGRFSAFGDLTLDASASVYQAFSVLRLAPSWRIPVIGGFSVVPGGAVQRADKAVQASASLTLLLKGRVGLLFLGGKYGAELRPAYLPLGAVFNYADPVKWSAWAGGAVKLGPRLRLDAGYAIDRLTPAANTSTGASTPPYTVHMVTLGVTSRF